MPTNCRQLNPRLSPNFYIMASLSFRLLPDRRKKNGNYGIYLAVSHNKQTRYISTDFEVSHASYFENGKAHGFKGAAAINKKLQELLDEYRNRLHKLIIYDYADCSSLKDALLQKPKDIKQATLHELIYERIQRLEADGKTNYAKMHRDSLKVYNEVLGNPFLREINRTQVKLLSAEMKKQGYSNATMQIRLAHLKAALNWAIDEKLVRYEDHPFTGLTMPSSGRRQTDLSIEQFQTLRDFEPVSKRAKFARDMFLLSFYLGGINLVDLLKVDLSSTELRYNRTKTRGKKNGESETVFTIPEVARPLIKKYAPKDKLVWPGNAERYEIVIAYINNCFAMLRKEVGITPLSYYSARHTVGQFSFEIGTPLEIVEYLLGQSPKTNRPIFNYCRVMKRQADAALSKLIEYTKHPEFFTI